MATRGLTIGWSKVSKFRKAFDDVFSIKSKARLIGEKQHGTELASGIEHFFDGEKLCAFITMALISPVASFSQASW